MYCPVDLTLPTQIIDLLHRYYNFDSIINLANYDFDLTNLKQKLINIKKNQFDSNDRIIFFDRESGFFVRQRDQIVWYNLQKILSDLDIPNKCCIIISQHDSQEYFNQLYHDLSTDDFPLKVFDYWLFADWMTIPDYDIPLNFDLIKKHYITLNRIRKKHRSLVVGYLEHYNILDKGLVSYNTVKLADRSLEPFIPSSTIINDPSRCHQYLTTFPYTRLNEDWHIRDLEVKKILETITNRGTNWVYKNYNETVDCKIYNNNTNSNSDLLQQAFLWIATESDAYSPVSFLSEKSAKSFYAKRPFVVVSGPYTLKRIQSFGFKTFGDFWDESYDEDGQILGTKTILNNINRLSKLSVDDLQCMYSDMMPILDHNYNVMMKMNSNSFKIFK